MTRLDKSKLGLNVVSLWGPLVVKQTTCVCVCVCVCVGGGGGGGVGFFFVQTKAQDNHRCNIGSAPCWRAHPSTFHPDKRASMFHCALQNAHQVLVSGEVVFSGQSCLADE